MHTQRVLGPTTKENKKKENKRTNQKKKKKERKTPVSWLPFVTHHGDVATNSCRDLQHGSDCVHCK
jgi:hypothetical protein